MKKFQFKLCSFIIMPLSGAITVDSQDDDSDSLPIAEDIFDEDELDQLYEAVIADEWSELMTVEEFLAVLDSWFETSH